MKQKTLNIFLIIVSTLLGAVGQLLFKYSFGSDEFLLILFAGLLAYVVSTLFYFYVLSRVHLSWAYSFGGLAYVFAVVFAAVLLNENVPLLRWVGVAMIFIGVILIGIT